MRKGDTLGGQRISARQLARCWGKCSPVNYGQVVDLTDYGVRAAAVPLYL